MKKTIFVAFLLHLSMSGYCQSLTFKDLRRVVGDPQKMDSICTKSAFKYIQPSDSVWESYPTDANYPPPKSPKKVLRIQGSERDYVANANTNKEEKIETGAGYRDTHGNFYHTIMYYTKDTIYIHSLLNQMTKAKFEIEKENHVDETFYTLFVKGMVGVAHIYKDPEDESYLEIYQQPVN